MSDSAPAADYQPNGLAEWAKYLATHGSNMPKPQRRKVYLVTLVAALLLIWAPVVLFLKFSPITYTSKWSLIMPVTGAGQTVNLESVGQATSSVTSPFSQASVDPKVNYKAIVTTKPVLQRAADKLDMSEGEFGKPKIKLVDLTALMKFENTGSSAQEAQDKAYALYESLQERLDELRQDEFLRREVYTNASLSSYSEKLTEAQTRIVQFQLQAKIISLEQFKDITLATESSRRVVAELRSRLSGLDARIEALQQALGVNAEQTNGLLALQRDSAFQELLRKKAEAVGTLAEYASRYGPRHHKVLDANEVLSALSTRLFTRAQAVGFDLARHPTLIEALSRDESTGGNIETLASFTAEAEGMRAELAAMNRQIVADLTRLEEGILDATTLEDLERKQQVALAVFTSALAKVDLGRADNFSSYPMLQMLAPPTLPYKPNTLGKALAVVGGVLGSMFCIAGLAILWVRKPFLQKILKSE